MAVLLIADEEREWMFENRTQSVLIMYRSFSARPPPPPLIAYYYLPMGYWGVILLVVNDDAHGNDDN